MADKFLDKVYGTTDADATRELYDDWSESYDIEIAENGYQTPARLARAMAQNCRDLNQPLLDYDAAPDYLRASFRPRGSLRLTVPTLLPECSLRHEKHAISAI